MPAILFSICFYQIHINMTNDCVSITKTLMMGVKVMTERYKKILASKVKVSAKISNCYKKNSYIFLRNNDCKSLYIDIYIDLLAINFNLLSVPQHYVYHQISDFEINTSLTTTLQLNTLFFPTQLVLYQIQFCVLYSRTPLDIKNIHNSSSYFISI